MHAHTNFVPTTRYRYRSLPLRHLHWVRTPGLHLLPPDYRSPPPEIPPDFVPVLRTSSRLPFWPPSLPTNPLGRAYRTRRPTHITSQRGLLFYTATPCQWGLGMLCCSFESLLYESACPMISPSAGHWPFWQDSGDKDIPQGIWYMIKVLFVIWLAPEYTMRLAATCTFQDSQLNSWKNEGKNALW